MDGFSPTLSCTGKDALLILQAHLGTLALPGQLACAGDNLSGRALLPLRCFPVQPPDLYEFPWLQLGGISEPGKLLWPGYPLPVELVRMQVISICIVLVPEHLHKDVYKCSPTEGRKEEGSLMDGTWGNICHVLTIPCHLLSVAWM